jgi:hypothetical protein
MERTFVRTGVLLICLIVAAYGPSRADWPRGGVLINSVAEFHDAGLMISDGGGGAIMAWTDSRSIYGGVYAQRIDQSGNVRWTSEGVWVTDNGNNFPVSLETDGAGGAILGWSAYPYLYASALNASGGGKWGGKLIRSLLLNLCCPVVVSDGSGGAIYFWGDERYQPGYDLYAQRIDAAGNAQWITDGVAVCTTSVDKSPYKPAPDGSGGAIVGWYAASDDFFIQRVSSSGVNMWGGNGVQLNTADVRLQPPGVVSADGAGGAVVAWPGAYYVRVQRVDALGTPLWPAGGVAAGALGTWGDVYSISDGAGGAFVGWAGLASGEIFYALYVQHVDASGNVTWNADGVRLANAWNPMGYNNHLSLVSDYQNGIIAVWSNDATGTIDSVRVRAQRINASGDLLWDDGGVEVYPPSLQADPASVADGDGGVLISWEDSRGGSHWDIYAHRLGPHGWSWNPHPDISSVKDVPDDQGGSIQIQWRSSVYDAYPKTHITEYSVWRRVDAQAYTSAGGGQNEIPGSGDLEAGSAPIVRTSGDYAWEWLANVPAHYFRTYALTVQSLSDSMGGDPGWQHFMVTAHTDTQYVYFDSPVDSGYSVDNLSPPPPAAFAIAYNAGSNYLTWDASQESDFHHFCVYRSEDPEFVPSSGDLVHTTTGVEWLDTVDEAWKYSYKISTVDVHGNEGDATGPASVSAAGDPGLPERYGLYQNVPNPFNPVTTIRYEVPPGGRAVAIRIYDPTGRLVKTLVDGTQSAGAKRVEWMGKDDRGHSVASGVYFYRMTAPGFEMTRKLVLIR